MGNSEYITNFWENAIYHEGNHMNRYPYDSVVSFVYRNYPKHKDRKDIEILEVGSGAGNNLWFAAREGFKVTGLEGSTSAVEYAKKRFEGEQLKGHFEAGDFLNLPYPDNTFDLVIDRASITCCAFNDAKKVIEGVNRVLTKQGRFFFNPYSHKHSSSLSGTKNEDGTRSNITEGTLAGVDHLNFFSDQDIKVLFPADQWKVISVEHCEFIEQTAVKPTTHAEFRVIAEKL